MLSISREVDVDSLKFAQRRSECLTRSFQISFFICYLADPWRTMGYSQIGSFTNPTLITMSMKSHSKLLLRLDPKVGLMAQWGLIWQHSNNQFTFFNVIDNPASNAQHLFKVNYKDARTTSVVLVFLFLTLNKFTHCSGISIVDFEQKNTVWEAIFHFCNTILSDISSV